MDVQSQEIATGQDLSIKHPDVPKNQVPEVEDEDHQKREDPRQPEEQDQAGQQQGEYAGG